MNGRSLILATALLTVSAAAPLTALACTVCVDDKVASVYDHAQVQRALSKGQKVVVCELRGAHDAATLASQAGKSAQGLRGVEPGSIRTSRDLPVMSFVLDPAAQSPDAAVAVLRQRLQRNGVTPTLLKVLETQPPANKSGT